MRSLFLVFVFFLLLISCDTNTPRRPVNHSTESFYKELIQQNKKLNAREKKFIESIIAKDSKHTYLQSTNGFWYYYDEKNNKETIKPKTGDIVTIQYEIFDIFDYVLYDKQEREVKVDKQDLIIGMMEGIKLMKVQEIVTFVIPSYRAYGVVGDENKIGVNQPIKVKIKLINVK